MTKRFYSTLPTSILTALAAGALFMGACSDDNGEEGAECSADDPCAEGFVCDMTTNMCVDEPDGEGCTSTAADCTATGEFCIAQDGETEKTCAVPASCAEVEAGDLAAYCAAQGVEGADADSTFTCGQDFTVANGCELGDDTATETARFVLISDFTTEDCDNEDDPGSDIMYVKLAATAGVGAAPLAFGTAVEADMGSTTTNKFGVSSPLTGTAPASVDFTSAEGEDDLGCYIDMDGADDDRFNDTSVYSTGCGGSVLVEFTGQNLMPGQYITVGEFAPICNQDNNTDATGTDLYNVVICPPVAADATMTIDTCTTDGNDLLTVNTGGITNTEITAASIPAADAAGS